MMVETVSVNIYNSEYKLRGDDSEKIRHAASIVDEQMRQVAAKAPMQPATTTAVLAALNTAELLVSERRSAQEGLKQLIDRLNQIDNRLQGLARSSDR